MREAHGSLRTILSLVWSETDGYAMRRFAVALALVMVSGALAALGPLIYKLIIDTFSGQSSSAGHIGPMMLIAGYALAQYLMRGTSELRGLAHGQGMQRLSRRLSRRLFGHILKLPLRFHLDRKTGAINETLGQGLSGCQTLLQHFVFTFLPVITEFLTITLVLVHFGHALYLWIFALSGLAYAVAFWRGAADIVTPSQDVSNAHIEAHAVLTDSLLNYETVKYFNAERDVLGRYDNALGDTESAWRKFLNFRLRNGILVATIFAISLGASLGFAGHEVLKGTMTVGDFVLINSYIIRLVQPLETIGFAIRDVSQGLAFTQRMLEMLREKPEGASLPPGPSVAAPEARGEIVFENVDFSYGPDRPILRNISFRVPAGHTTAIVGVSGSGKSSLIRLLFRLYEPDRGKILLDNQAIDETPFDTLRQAIAVVPQDTMLFNDTIGRNIGFGRREATQQEIEEAARMANLHEFITRLPKGYETQVGERGLKLSGGEKQRVAIARAALKRPRVFVFDEATSSLDSKTEREILQNLLEVAKRSTTLVIAHRLSTVVHADEILVLHQGAIVERGTHAELLERNEHYAGLWRAQQSGRVRDDSSASSRLTIVPTT